MRRNHFISFFFISLIFSSIWLFIPYFVTDYLYDPEVENVISGNLGSARYLELSGVSNVSMKHSISCDKNFTVIIEYCNFTEDDPIEEAGLHDLVISDSAGLFNFFILFVNDTQLIQNVNSSVLSNRISPQNMTHFQFESTINESSFKIGMAVEPFQLIRYHAELSVSYMYYLPKLRQWVWISPIVIVGLVLGSLGIFFYLKRRKSNIPS